MVKNQNKVRLFITTAVMSTVVLIIGACSIPTSTLPTPSMLPENPVPKDLRSYVASWPEECKLVIERDVVAIFTYPHPAVLWDQTASIYHIPSMSRVDLNRYGEVAIIDYKNEEGKQRLQRILTDDSLMNLIRSLIPWDNPQPN